MLKELRRKLIPIGNPHQKRKKKVKLINTTIYQLGVSRVLSYSFAKQSHQIGRVRFSKLHS